MDIEAQVAVEQRVDMPVLRVGWVMQENGGAEDAGGVVMFADDVRMLNGTMRGAQRGCDVAADFQAFAGLEMQCVKGWMRVGEGGRGEEGVEGTGITKEEVRSMRVWCRKMDTGC